MSFADRRRTTIVDRRGPRVHARVLPALTLVATQVVH